MGDTLGALEGRRSKSATRTKGNLRGYKYLFAVSVHENVLVAGTFEMSATTNTAGVTASPSPSLCAVSCLDDVWHTQTVDPLQ